MNRLSLFTCNSNGIKLFQHGSKIACKRVLTPTALHFNNIQARKFSATAMKLDKKEDCIDIIAIIEKADKVAKRLLDAERYLNKKNQGYDPISAFQIYLAEAKNGSSLAQHNVGVCYFKGIGVEINEKKALKWIKKSAENGFLLAQQKMADCCMDGLLGVEKNEKEAVVWLKRAAYSGYANSQYNLGCCYEHGLGIEVNLLTALQWYEKAAKQGHEDARNKMISLIKQIHEEFT